MTFNPADWYQTRRVSFIPQHFHLVQIHYSTESLVESWILKNTSGRYAFGKNTFGLTDNVIISVGSLLVAFEDPQEATHFLLIKDSVINIDFDF